MRRIIFFCTMVSLLATSALAHTVNDPTGEAEFEAWCQKRAEWLVKPDGYLSLVALHWLTETPQQLPDIGDAYTDGTDVVLDLEPGWSLEGKPVARYRVTPEQAPLLKFTQDSRHFYVNHHGSRINIRVKDSNSPHLESFQGVERLPYDPSWRLVGRFVADPATIPVTSVVDETVNEGSPGYAEFERDGRTHKVRLMGEGTSGSYFLVFSDETAGKTTYAACRFLDVEKGADGSLLLDFNRAWNPPCSMTPYATCPLPPAGNVLPIEIHAGELAPAAGES